MLEENIQQSITQLDHNNFRYIIKNSIFNVDQFKKKDFVKKMHYYRSSTQQPFSQFNKKQQILLSLYENEFKVKISTRINDVMEHKDISFESVPYDALFLKNKKAGGYQQVNPDIKPLIVSNRGMPVRIYKLNTQNISASNQQYIYSTFYDKKPNSQAFMAPYQFAMKNNVVVGVGRKFFNIYDCEKVITTRLKAFDQVHLSTVQLLNQNIAFIGDFVGKVSILDLRQIYKPIVQSFTPHVDAVFHIKSIQNNQNLFLTSARRDNFTYIFDKRNLSTFVNCYEFERFSNQRYGLTVSKDIILFGTQNSEIHYTSINDTNQNKNIIKINDYQAHTITDITVLSHTQDNIQFICSQGTRVFQDLQSQDQENNGNSIQKSHNFYLKTVNLNLK